MISDEKQVEFTELNHLTNDGVFELKYAILMVIELVIKTYLSGFQFRYQHSHYIFSFIIS